MARASQDEGIASIRLALMRAHELVPAITRAGQEATALPPLSLEAIDSVDLLRGHTADDPIQIDLMHQADDSITNGVASPLGAWGNGLYAREQASCVHNVGFRTAVCVIRRPLFILGSHTTL